MNTTILYKLTPPFNHQIKYCQVPSQGFLFLNLILEEDNDGMRKNI